MYIIYNTFNTSYSYIRNIIIIPAQQVFSNITNALNILIDLMFSDHISDDYNYYKIYFLKLL